ncbi:MAG: IPT/TIG domain-containing protein [Archangium sp.]|nr:IPT/TIG domain-containing protein [Archangium sp.]
MKRILAPALVVVLAACPEPMPMPDGGTNPAPIVTSIAPVTGPIAGGTSVTINGTNFVTGSTVTFGALPATATFESERRLIAVTPASSAGVVSVTVTNPAGRASTLANAFTFTGTTTTLSIAEAILQNPADTTDTSGASTVSVPVIAHVQVPTVTNGTGQGMGVRAQVGFGTTVGAPPVVADFTWTDAVYLGDVDGPASGDKLRDSYSGSVSLPSPSTGTQLIYFLAARFSVDNGQTWTIADRDGSANGVLTTQLSRVTVALASVEWCKLGGEVVEAPPSVALRGSAMGPIVYGQVFKTAVTSQPGAGTGIKGALGYGQAGTDPATWTWVAATFNTDTGGGQNDEFQAQLPNPGDGTYKYAFRFNHADGPWSYCDADGLTTNGFTEAQAGTLTVQPIGVDSCVLQFPPTLTSFEGRQTDFVYGRVFVAGLTETTGAAAGIEGELGFGAASTPPTDASWSWSAGAFNIDVTGGGEEYQARLTGPAPGSWAYAYRFRVSGGPWTYCDKTGSTDGLQQNELGALTAAPFDVTNCVLESTNAMQTVLPNAVSQPYTVLIEVPTLTEGMGQGTPLSVQLGSGAPGSAPSTWTNWMAASYTNDVTTADRYSATLTAPSSVGSAAVAYRVQVGARAPVYCDLDGSQNGFQQAQAGRLAVSNAIIQSCRLSTVSGSPVASGSSLTVTARTLVPGVSGNAGASPNLRMQIGNGPVNDNASTSSLWGWKEASFSADVAGDDEFTLTAYPAYTGGRAVSARASLDGVIWTYCDLNGSDVGGYETNQQFNVTVTPHMEFDFCNLQAPATADGGSVIYGQIYEPGLTPNAATPFIAQLGIGKESEDPGFAWKWQPATFNVISGNNNEYQSALPTDGGVGLRYAFRYSLDAGVWCYGDLNGSQDGFSGGANIGLIE